MIKEVLKKILPPCVMQPLDKINSDKLFELRLRSKGAVTVWYGNGYRYLSKTGISDSPDNAVFLDCESIKDIMLRACEKSVYAVNDRICMGFLTLDGGIRIGIAGETVFENNEIKTIKNFSSLNIRIPHEIIGCANKIVSNIGASHGYYNTLVIAPPGAGKTTILRDMARIVASEKRIINVLIADERNEIAAVMNGKQTLNVGNNVDMICCCTKEYAFIRAIRSLRPDIIVTDELCGDSDIAAVENAVGSGVTVFASVHADNHLRLKEKRAFAELIKNKSFGRFVDISCARGPGTVEGIYDENFSPVSGVAL